MVESVIDRFVDLCTKGRICPFMSNADKCIICKEGYLEMSESIDRVIADELSEQIDNHEMKTMIKIAKLMMPTEMCRAWDEQNLICKRLSQ